MHTNTLTITKLYNHTARSFSYISSSLVNASVQINIQLCLSQVPIASRQTKPPVNISPDRKTTHALPGFPFPGHKQAASAGEASDQERPLTFAAPPCRPHDSRSGGRSAAPSPRDAPSGSWLPARLCPAERRPRARLPHERRPKALDLSGTEERLKDFRGESSKFLCRTLLFSVFLCLYYSRPCDGL